MKKFTKGFTLMTVSALIGLGLAACGNNDNGAAAPGTTDENGAVESVTIRYANWNLGTEEDNNLERRMIEAFMDAHPHIIVEIDDSFTGVPWNEALNIAASTGNLPDVFASDVLTNDLINGWVMDLTTIAEGNTEFMNLPQATREAVTINDKIYAIPMAQFMLGFYVNRTLFDDLNLNAPQHGFSVDEFFDSVRATTDLNRPSIGVDNLADIVGWYPGAVNSGLGFFAYQDGTFNIDSAEMREALRLAGELGQNGFVWSGLSEEQREQNFGTIDSTDAFRNGEMAFWWSGTWMNGQWADQLTFDWDFVGVPGGRSVLAMDVLTIAATTAHPEEAFLFAQWMGFGNEGFTTRMEIAEANNMEINSLPVTTDATVLARYWEMVNVPGVRAAYENLDDAMIEGRRFVPGFVEARWTAPTGISIPGTDYDNATIGQIIDHSIIGNVNFADHATNIHAIAQDAHDRAADAISE